MGKAGGLDPGKGAIWRYYRGKIRCLFPGLTIPNSICFTPDGRFAHFSDTVTHRVMRVVLDAEGWPAAAPEVFLDLTVARLPDGATIDAKGVMWLAEWGAGRIAAYSAEGRFIGAVAVGVPNVTCPAFGGAGFNTLYVTTAREGMSDAALLAYPDAGKVFALPGLSTGLPEPRFIP